MLVFFLFDSTDKPLYVGSTQILGSGGSIDPISVQTSRLKHSWLLKINVDDYQRYYLIECRRAFSKFESQFSVSEVEYLRATSLDGSFKDKTIKSSDFERSPGCYYCRSALRTLAWLPRDRGISTPGSPLSIPTDPRCLSEHIGSGNIVVMNDSKEAENAALNSASNASVEDRELNFHATAVLLRPYSGCVYRNVAVAPVPTDFATVRVAIIWQSLDAHYARSELYSYDIPQSNYRGRYSSFGEYLATLRKSEVAGGLKHCFAIQGKRVTSLSGRVGGIHRSSSVWGFPTDDASKVQLRRDAEMGGLRLPHAFGDEELRPLRPRYQKGFVWGPIYIYGKFCVHYM